MLCLFRFDHFEVTHCHPTSSSVKYSGFNTDLISSCRLLYSVFAVLLIVFSKSKHRCLAFVPIPPDGVSNAECRPVDIQLYTWSGPGFESGECWYRGHRFLNGAIWGRTDMPGSPYCVCEQGKVRVFYSQQRSQSPAADSLTILGPIHGSSPTSKDLAKWPIPDLIRVRQRSVICSVNRLGIRVRSRDGCTGCKCSKNGHWLCRKPPKTKRNHTKDVRSSSRNTHYSSADASNSVNVQLRVTTARVRPQCPTGTTPQFCILIERLASSNISEKASRYIEIPRETSWTDRNGCTRCSCTLDGRLTCEYLYATCSRSCLIQKTRPIPLMYYFPPDSKWLTPPADKCRSCTCVNGQRKCINCDQVLEISIDSKSVFDNNNDRNQQGSPIGEYRLLPAVSTSVKIKPCLLQIDSSSHQLILPGQQTWFGERCYLCSKRNGRLLFC